MPSSTVRERIDGLSGSLRSRAFSLKALAEIFDDWPNVLRIYFIDGEARVKIHDHKGGELWFSLDRKNVNKSIQLARALCRCRGKYELKADNITIHFSRYERTIRLHDALSYAADDLATFCFLSYLNGDVTDLDEQHYVIYLDELRWAARKGVPNDITGGPLLSHWHEPYEYKWWFLKALQPRGIFIDVGAYVGGYSIRADKRGAEAIALESNRENFTLLMKNIELNGCSGIRASNVTVGSVKGTRAMHIQEEKDRMTYSLVGEGPVVDYVDVVTLDEAVLNDLDGRSVDLMKIDVEGAELEVLQTGLAVLSKTAYLMLEVLPDEETKLLGLLKKHKFKLADRFRRPGVPYYNAFFKKE